MPLVVSAAQAICTVLLLVSVVARVAKPQHFMVIAFYIAWIMLDCAAASLHAAHLAGELEEALHPKRAAALTHGTVKDAHTEKFHVDVQDQHYLRR